MNELNTITKEFITLLERFEYTFTGYDKIWTVSFPMTDKKWVSINVTLYDKNYYLNESLQKYPSLEMAANKKEVKAGQTFGLRSNFTINAWLPLLQKAIVHLHKVQKNWLLENTNFQNNFPLKYRKGIVPHAIINAYFPNLLNVSKIVGQSNAKQIIKIIDSNYFRKEDELEFKTFTAMQYFNYCKVAYNATIKKLDSKIKFNGKELYQTYADGRHEGLLDIKVNNEKEFADWIDGKHPKKTIGGHPWEILRGGNTTHISLRVSRPSYLSKDGFILHLEGNSLNRLKETINIALALKKADLPFLLHDSENIRLRLLAQDNIGIVPEHHTLHRANQDFSEPTVIDVLYLDAIKRKQKAIVPFITWESLPILKPI